MEEVEEVKNVGWYGRNKSLNGARTNNQTDE